MTYQMWSWVLGILGLLGFYLAGKKVWWCWYINIFNQILWLAYSLISQQYGFLVATAGYTIVFVKNAYSWTREHREKKYLEKLSEPIGTVTNLEERDTGLFFEVKLDSEDFVKKIKQTMDEADMLATSVFGEGGKVVGELIPKDVIRAGWKPSCYEVVVYNGQNYMCAQRQHPEDRLDIIPHWARADVRTHVTEPPKIADIFWDKSGITHIIEVQD